MGDLEKKAEIDELRTKVKDLHFEINDLWQDFRDDGEHWSDWSFNHAWKTWNAQL